jgi:hypothetical protein
MKIFTKIIKLAFIVLSMGLTTITVHAQSGNVLDFDGINDYVQIPYNATLSKTHSIQLWARVNTNNGISQSIITCGGYSNGYNGLGYNGFEINANPDGKWYLLVSKGGSNFIPIQGPDINYGIWTNIAATYDGITVKLYFNGVLSSAVAVSGLTTAVLPTRIGAGNSEGTPNDFLGGQIDELSFWAETLTPSEITSNMNNSLSGSETNLLGYYNFNEGIGNADNTTPPVNTLNDGTTNHNNGTLLNFALNGNTSNWVSTTSLPVNLVSFTGTNRDGTNLLQWSTASEQNSSRFEIQRSENGNDFNTIATVGAAGNSDKLINYQYEDRQLANVAKYYYRLKMVDKDGATKYSAVIFIKNSTSTLATVYPNPARDKVTINISDNSLLHTKALLTDANGKVLQRISINSTGTPVNLSQYVRGTYLVKFQDGSSVKIVKE